LITEVVIPVMDQTGGDFLLAKWLKHVGDVVEAGDALCEVETNKASVEITAEASGVLRKLLVREGAALPSLTVVALIGGAGEPLPDVDPYYRVQRRSPSQSSPAPGVPALSESPAEKHSDEITASPRAKRLAAEHLVDLSTLSGSGPDGRIVEDDVRRALKLI
jgi:pyruvate dehydrogenase E2 component (dihydrolipoamide acetyltransferase)